MNSLPEQLLLNFPKETLPLLTVNEIYEKADQALLEALKEDRRLERKAAGVQSRSLGDYFSMFANTKPDGGVLVVGQENDGQMSGCSKASQNQLKYRKAWIDKDASTVVGAVIASGLDENERRIINFIAEHGPISVSQVQRLTQKTWPAASKMLKRLADLGILEYRKSPALKDRDPGARYALKGRFKTGTDSNS